MLPGEVERAPLRVGQVERRRGLRIIDQGAVLGRFPPARHDHQGGSARREGAKQVHRRHHKVKCNAARSSFGFGDIAGLALFLCSEAGRFCTGGTYMADGGYTA